MASGRPILFASMRLAVSLSGARAAADFGFIQVDGDQLRRCGAPLRLKGSNLEGNRYTSNTIWRVFGDYLNTKRNVLFSIGFTYSAREYACVTCRAKGTLFRPWYIEENPDLVAQSTKFRRVRVL